MSPGPSNSLGPGRLSQSWAGLLPPSTAASAASSPAIASSANRAAGHGSKARLGPPVDIPIPTNTKPTPWYHWSKDPQPALILMSLPSLVLAGLGFLILRKAAAASQEGRTLFHNAFKIAKNPARQVFEACTLESGPQKATTAMERIKGPGKCN